MGLKRLGAEKISARPLDFIWVLDVSGSMHGERIASLNYAIKEVIPSMKQAARENVNADIRVRALTFSTDSKWHIEHPTPVKEFEWQDIKPGGLTNLGSALNELASVLDDSVMPDRGLPPVLVLVTDGLPTDDYRQGLDLLNSKRWGKKAIRLAVSVSDDVEDSVLEDFIGNKQIKPFKVEHASHLTQYIKFVSTRVLSSVSSVKIDEKTLLNFDFELPDDHVQLSNHEAYDRF